MKNRTPQQLPNHLHLGDVDGDGTDEFLQVADNRLLVFRTNFEATGVLHHYFPSAIELLIIGDFTVQGREHGREQVCVILADGSLRAYAISDDLQELWRWFTQPSIIVPRDERVTVGDFNGDGADEILVRNVTSGALRMYSRLATGFFAPAPGFAPGDLSAVNLVGTRIGLLAGTFQQGTGRDDLLVVDYGVGQISRFDSVTGPTPAEATTFRRVFSANGGILSRSDQVVVANIEGGPTEGFVIHSRSSSLPDRLYRAEYGTGGLAHVSGASVSIGQLPAVGGNSLVASARLKEADKRSEPGGTLRHDFLFFDTTAHTVTRTDGRYDPAGSPKFTYWYAYKKNTPAYNQGWPSRRDHKWAVLLAHLADYDQPPKDTNGKSLKASFFKRLFTSAGAGQGGMTDYFLDISYGTFDIGSTEVLPADDAAEWYKSRYATLSAPHGTVEDPVDHQMKEARQALFDDIVRVSGIDRSQYAHVAVVFNVAGTAYGGSPEPNWVTLDALDPYTLEGFGTSGMAQEMLHAYSLNHTFDDMGNTYGDRWDVMSAFDVASFTDPNTLVPTAPNGPEMNAAYKAWLGFLPAGRVLTLTPNPSGPRTYTVPLAAINRPEANGYLTVKIGLPIPAGSGVADHAVFIELRQQKFWDRNIPHDMVVLLHEYIRKQQESYFHSGMSSLLKSQGGPEFFQGMTFRQPLFTVTVKEVHGSNHQQDAHASTATVSITC